MPHSPAPVESRLDLALRGATCHGPVSEAVITSAEARLDVQFPPSFRVFLRHHGASFGKGLELAGLPVSDWNVPEQMPQWSDVLAETLRSRQNRNGPLPFHLLPISHDGTDFEYLLDIRSRSADGECPVVVLGPGRELDRVAESFVEFVERSCRGEAL
jgi:antitoxin YobK